MPGGAFVSGGRLVSQISTYRPVAWLLTGNLWSPEVAAEGETRVKSLSALFDVEGRRLKFEVEAHDEKEKIGGGAHERVVVNVERFDERVKKKIAAG